MPVNLMSLIFLRKLSSTGCRILLDLKIWDSSSICERERERESEKERETERERERF